MNFFLNLLILFSGLILFSQNPEVAPCDQSNQRTNFDNSLGISDSAQLIAADINVPANEMFTLTTIELNLDVASGNAGISSADIIIRSAQPNNLPGDEIYSDIQNVPVSQVFLETTSNGSNIYLITFDLPAPVFLSGTQSGAKYWVQLAGNPVNAGTYVGWETTTENIEGSGFAINLGGDWAIVSTNDVIYTFFGDCDILGGAENYFEGNKFILYPNPSTHEFSLINVGNFYEENIRMIIYDVSGNKVIEEKYQSLPYDISKFPSGLYVVSITNGKLSKNLKLIKQ